jgi:hypothetical protein
VNHGHRLNKGNLPSQRFNKNLYGNPLKILLDFALFIYKEFTLDLPNTQFSTIDEGYFLACAMGLQNNSGKYMICAMSVHEAGYQ